jgi:hypothetical protein
MRTASTKQVELMAYEKLSDVSVITGAVKTIYKRHQEFFNMTFCLSLGLLFGLIVGSQL